MIKKLMVLISAATFFLLVSTTAIAQPFFKKSLNDEILNRWMITTNEIKPFSELLDSMHKTETEALAFEALTTLEQDKKVQEFLVQHQVEKKMTALVKSRGWKSVGDYMRTSAQIGNAIAAHFQEDIIANLPPEQAQALREKMDPAIVGVSSQDLQFVQKNIVTIQKFMQDYAGVIAE